MEGRDFLVLAGLFLVAIGILGFVSTIIGDAPITFFQGMDRVFHIVAGGLIIGFAINKK